MSNGLKRFQEYGDTKGLLEFVETSGRRIERYQEVISELTPVFDALNHGEQPAYEKLDSDALDHLKPEVEDIVRWMCGSNKADIRTRGIELMGALGYESFLAQLEHFLDSQVKWERLTAIIALGRIPASDACELLRKAIEDPDPEVRAEVRRALKTREHL